MIGGTILYRIKRSEAQHAAGSLVVVAGRFGELAAQR